VTDRERIARECMLFNARFWETHPQLRYGYLALADRLLAMVHKSPETIRYRLEALGWKRKYEQLQAETAERLEKLEPWMVDWLGAEATQAECDDMPEWAEAGRQVAAAIHHAIGEETP